MSVDGEHGKRFARLYVDKIPLIKEQRQDSLVNQLEDLRRVAIRLGMYDAADWMARRYPLDS
jgi:hypothetical protein